MKALLLILYRIYQILFMFPTVFGITLVTGIITSVGSLLGGGRFWGYWPPKIWAKAFVPLRSAALSPDPASISPRRKPVLSA